MALMDFIRGQFIDIIQWTDDSRDTLSYRFPDEDKEIKNGAQLIVRESQIARNDSRMRPCFYLLFFQYGSLLSAGCSSAN
jgi:SPFH domain-Band 7 family